MTTAQTLPLAAYTRVSTAGQAESGIGLAAQRQSITDAARTLGVVVGDWFEDAGRSGAKMTNRPGLQAALEAVRAGRCGGLVVAKIDRLGRSYETMMLVGQAAREGWRLVALDVGLDTTTAEGELVAGALTMAARFEWRRISQRQLEKHDELRRQGRPRAGVTVSPAVVELILRARATGASYAQIAAALNRDAIPTARRARRWYPSSVRSAVLTRERERAAQVGARPVAR